MLLACLALVACDDAEGDIRANVRILSERQGVLATAAADHLAGYGRRAIPTIEAALHTATPIGRKNLVLGLRRIGDADAVPLLRHLAVYDPSPDVAREAEWTLKTWAADAKAPDRAARARKAVREAEEARRAEAAG